MGIVAEVNSSINGHLRVEKTLVWGTHITASGLTQSGGIAEAIWKHTLTRVKKGGHKITTCLILGLAGGSIAKLVRKNWKEAKITGVEIDPAMIYLGKKYMGLEKWGVDIKIQDAEDFCKSTKDKFDLICMDTYTGDAFPEKFEDEKFLQLLKRLVTERGVVVFNRLYYADKRPQAVKFGEKLEGVFSRVDWVYPEANLLFICS